MIEQTISQVMLLSETKAAAAFALAQLRLPHNRDEQWRNTNIQLRYKPSLSTNNSFDFTESNLPFSTTKIIIQDSKILSHNNLPDGVLATMVNELNDENKTILSQFYNTIASQQEYFSVENTANTANVLFIHIKQNQTIDEVLHIVNKATSLTAINFSRILIIAEKNSSAKIWIDEIATNEAICNSVIEIFLEENAILHFHLHQNKKNATSITTINSQLTKNAQLHYSNWAVGNNFQRNNISAKIAGSGANAIMNGLYINGEKQLTDNHIFTSHDVPNTESTQFYKGILNDAATGIFNGKIYVKQDAQKTNAYQNSKAILNSNDAFVFSKPELEIFADDVKCSHGVAIGQLNQRELFYFMARGVDKLTAQNMLNFAFANDVIEKISFDGFKDYLRAELGNLFSVEL